MSNKETQRGGVTSAPGVYTVGQRFQNGRGSGSIVGARVDAAHVVDHIERQGRPSRLSPEGAS